MASERITEDIALREMKCHLGKNDFGHVFSQGDVEELDKVNALLKEAGGKPQECSLNDYSSGGKGKGQPEFIITFNDDRNTIIVVECKKTTSKHETEEKHNPKAYAVDGVLYYAKFLKKEYNVIAIAISGTKKETLRVSTFYWQKGQDSYNELRKATDIILEPKNYVELIKGKKLKKSYSLDEIRNTAILMHDYLREIKVPERHKPIFIAGILIALDDKDFVKAYEYLPSFKSVIEGLSNAIEHVLENSEIKSSRIEYIQQAFKGLSSNSKFQAIPLAQRKSITWYVEQLELKIKPMMDYADSTIDALGVFYHEFIKYSGGDGKGLGIVLTPHHLTEFMCDLANVNKKSKVIDICCGSGAFLVTAMSKMFKDANPKESAKIRAEQLYGIEFDEELYSLAVANMIIRKDGKSNVYYGDCFDETIASEIEGKGINVGLINPPYAQEDKSELDFTEQLLDMLVQNGIGVCIVPMSCALGTKFKDVRKRLFKKHTLKAVFSMPIEVFSPVNVATCIMVWEAHNPHDINKETFFGYYRKDGFVKKKHLGRIDYNGEWKDIKAEWLSLYHRMDVEKGKSVIKSVCHEDEWCAEAYMETDYSKLTEKDFADTLKKFVAYQFLNEG